jgi:hypothetical protein
MQYSTYSLSNASGCPTMTVDDGGTCDGKTGSCIPSHRDLSIEDINTIHQMYQLSQDGADAGADLGAAMASADFDGDGYRDLAVAAPSREYSGSDVGRVYVYKGVWGKHTVTSSGAGGVTWSYTLVPWTKLSPSDFGKAGQDGEEFGAALKAGDFNGDGISDLAIGAPGRNSEKGAVYVMYGHAYVQPTSSSSFPTNWADGLLPADSFASGASAYLTYDNLGAGTGNNNDHFGRAIAVGDVDGDGVNELAIGVPGRGAGRVVLLHHTTPTAPMTWWKNLQSTGGVTGDQFGKDIAINDWDGDGAEDVAVGAPQTYSTGGGKLYLFRTSQGLAQSQSTGLVGGVTGDDFGIELEPGQYYTNGTYNLAVSAPGVLGYGRIFVYKWDPTYNFVPIDTIEQVDGGGTNGSGDRFGEHMRSAYLHGSQHEDLIVGVPDKDDAGKSNAGMVYVLRADDTHFYTGTIHHAPTAKTDGRFGEAVNSGDFDNSGSNDVAVGEPGANASGTSTANGLFHSYKGSSTGLTGTKATIDPTQQIVAP